MPSLRRLLSELRRLRVDPDDIRVPGRLYDDLLDQAGSVVEENPEPEEE